MPRPAPHPETAGRLASLLRKSAAVPQLAELSGRLYASRTGWIMLSVPNALGRGAFDALNEPGAELPTDADTGLYNAHISVIRPEELKKIGLAPTDIAERGHEYTYTLGPVRDVVPDGWPDISKVWFIEVSSPSLKTLRRSYGLPPLPGDNYQFHITFAVRRRGVLYTNQTTKAASYHTLASLLRAKTESDRRNYAAKHEIMSQLMRRAPADFVIDSTSGDIVGVTHKPTRFRLHLPAKTIPATVSSEVAT